MAKARRNSADGRLSSVWTVQRTPRLPDHREVLSEKKVARMRFIKDPVERTTSLTDGILALVAMGAVLYLQSGDFNDTWKTNIWSWAFGFIAISSALGTIAHGLVLSETSHQRIWQAINLGLGLSVSLFVVGVAYDLWGTATARPMLWGMLVLGCSFYAVTRIFPGIFFVFIIFEGIALIFALVAYSWIASRGALDGAVLMAAGVLVSLVAAGIQAAKNIKLKLIWTFDHNGLFHLVQGVGLVLLVMGLKSML